MIIRTMLFLSCFFYCSWTFGQTYDFYKRCTAEKSKAEPIEQIKINNCARSLYCDSYTMYLLWDCGSGKGLYHSLRRNNKTPSHVNSVKFLKDEALISIVTYDIKKNKTSGKVIRGHLGGEVTTIDQIENGIFKFKETKTDSYEKFIQAKCTKDSISFPNLKVCFKKSN